MTIHILSPEIDEVTNEHRTVCGLAGYPSSHLLHDEFSTDAGRVIRFTRTSVAANCKRCLEAKR